MDTTTTLQPTPPVAAGASAPPPSLRLVTDDVTQTRIARDLPSPDLAGQSITMHVAAIRRTLDTVADRFAPLSDLVLPRADFHEIEQRLFCISAQIAGAVALALGDGEPWVDGLNEQEVDNQVDAPNGIASVPPGICPWCTAAMENEMRGHYRGTTMHRLCALEAEVSEMRAELRTRGILRPAG